MLLISLATSSASFVYDGNGDRVKKTENSVTVLYVNKYYEKDLTNNVITTYYYLGGSLVAKRAGTTLNYLHQDHLTGTSAVSDSNGASAGRIKYYPFGSTRSSTGTLPDQKFTGQRLDGTGLYFYNARYYDATIGRFISPDPLVSHLPNPQSLNPYSYVLNSPLKLVDPSGLTGVYWNYGGGERIWVDASMLGVEGFAADNPELAMALITQMEQDNYDNPSAMSPGTNASVVKDASLYKVSNTGDVTIVHAANDTYIIVYNPPAQGQTSGKVRATVLWKDDSKTAQAQDVSIEVGAVPPGAAAVTWTPNWIIRIGDSFDKHLTVDILAHEATHVRQAITSGLGNMWSVVYAWNWIIAPFGGSWWDSQEAGAYATHREWYLTARVPYVVGVVP